MRTIKPGIKPVKFVGEDDHIPIIGFSNERDSFHLSEILCLGQSNPHPISRVSAVGDDVRSLQKCYPRVFHAELFILGKRAVALRSEKRLWIGRKVEAIGAAGQTYDGASGAKMGAE